MRRPIRSGACAALTWKAPGRVRCSGIARIEPTGDPAYTLPIARTSATWPNPRTGARNELPEKPEQDDRAGTLLGVLTLFGACAVTFMVLMYALERRGRGFILAFAFACGCACSSFYGFLAGTWPFGAVEAIWAVIALKRYRSNPTTPLRSAET